MKKNKFIILSGLSLWWMICSSLSGQTIQNSLEQNFLNPPASARPRTWWHWTNGNITRDGITKDLEWMKRAGIAGFQLADVGFGSGQSIENKVMFMTPEWLDALHHAAKESERLDLEMGIFSSAGWSLTGGPWVKPEQAMKKLVWSEHTIKGPGIYKGKLPDPPSNNGPIRNFGSSRENPDPTFYKDCAVLAIPVLKDVDNVEDFHPAVMLNDSLIDPVALLDDELNTELIILNKVKNEPVYIQFDFGKVFTARAVTIGGRRGVPVGRLQASEDGIHFKTLVTFPGQQLYRQSWIRTYAFPETSARYFRLEITGAPLNPAATMYQYPQSEVNEYQLNEFKLHSEPRVHHWEEKAGYRHLFEYESVPTPDIPESLAIPASKVLDITDKMDEEGNLIWKVPPGKWRILRFGYSLTGAKNRPPVPQGSGYEVDKLSPKHTRDYLKNYTDPIIESLGSLYGSTLRTMVLDSWEAGTQNWTDEMISEFEKRRGYNPLPWLPVLSGRIIESAELSDRFLWDFRRTLADMFAENHYGVVSEFLKDQGISTYGEASGVSLEILEDALLCKKFMDIPMGEFWVWDLHPSAMYYEDIRGAASAAHVYGKNIVAAEALTGGRYESPFTLKKVCDYWFAQGVNQMVFHTSAHQPLDTKPGNTMVGTHLHRNITWAEMAKPFTDYFARTSFLLQQGKPVRDILYLLNEGAPSTMPIWGEGIKSSVPEGYDYDYINVDALLNRLSVDSTGRLVLPDGMRYILLVLPEIRTMTSHTLKKLRDLTEKGAILVGPKPVRSPSLVNFPECARDIQTISEGMWGDLDGISRTRRSFGKGMIYWGIPLSEILSLQKIAEDVEYSQPLDMKLSWTHRRTADADIYFLSGNAEKPVDLDVRFRVNGKIPEIWYTEDPRIESSSWKIENGRTTIPIHLPEHGSVFVIFRDKTENLTRIVPESREEILTTLDGSWQVTFPPGMGAPEEAEFSELHSWTEDENEGIQYFSGTATYSKTVKVSKKWLRKNPQIMLDLGEVYDIAEVRINGQSPKILWKAPWRMDVTSLIKPGKNTIEIKITNQWTNRIVGDHKDKNDVNILPGSDQIRFFGPEPPLQKSGLQGPVKLISVTNS